MSKRQVTVLQLIRCGETTWSRDGRIEGAADLPLSDRGRASVATDVGRIAGGAATMVHHPGDEAATDTAQIVAAHIKAKSKTAPDLRNPNLGLLEGLTQQAFAERFPKRHKQWQEDPLSLAPPEGEDLTVARARIFAAVAKLIRRSKRDELSVVLHPLGLGLLRCWMADSPPTELWGFLEDRPRIERYALTPDLVDRLEAVALAKAG